MEVKWSLGLESNMVVEVSGGWWAREEVKELSQESAEEVEDKDGGTLEATLMVVTCLGGWSGTLSHGLMLPSGVSGTFCSLTGWSTPGGGEVE